MRIIWAMDAFEDNKELNQKLADTLTTVHEKTNAQIEPVYLLQENEVILPTYEAPTWVTDHSKTAETLFNEILEDYKMPFLQKPHVIPHASQSHAGAASVLSDYAERTKTDLILVGSHGRKGFQRFILGSFAESLLVQSKIPIFLMSSHCTQPSKIQNILFPTEFGEHSKDSFRHVLKLAQLFQASVTLLHAIPRPIEGVFELHSVPRTFTYKGQMSTLEQIIEDQVSVGSAQGERWKNWAKKDGVVLNYVIDQSFQPLDKLINDCIVSEKISLVVMEAQSGSISATLLGSTLRNVIRTATCPVYVIPKHYYDLFEVPTPKETHF